MKDLNEGLCLGLVGGLGVGAAMQYYRELAAAHARRGSPMRLVMIHADLYRVLSHAAAGETDALAEYLAELIGRLKDAGAEIAAIPAVTPHICEPRLQEIASLSLVSLVEEIVCSVGLRRLSRVALFGTRFAVESGLFGRLGDVDVIPPRTEEVEAIHAAYLGIVNAGADFAEVREILRRIAHRLCDEEGVEAIILAGTELSLVFGPENTDFPCIDGTRLHLDAIMRTLFLSKD
jgi:aspartate racemase